MTVAGIPSDRLYPLELQEELGRLLPGGRPVAVVQSAYGHDGFLLEVEQIGSVIRSALRT
jgi:homoserine O-acetyltransferase